MGGRLFLERPTATLAGPFEAGIAAFLTSCGVGGSVVLAAVSGGADSTALLAALAALRGSLGFTLHCVHVNHGLREPEEHRADAAAVRTLCRSMAVPSAVYRIPQGKIAALAGSEGIGVEAAARRLRHGILARERRRVGAGWVALGHTRDDALEHILIRFLRGAGPAGLAALPSRRGPLIRPLLGFTRKDVEEYLAFRGLSFRVDFTNADTRYFRNLIRAKLVPFLDEGFPHWRSSVASLAETQSMAAAYLSFRSEREIAWETVGTGRDVFLRTGAEAFFDCLPIIREEALFAAVDRLALRRGSRSDPGPDGDAPPGSVPRRKSLRLFASGAAASLDLGRIRVDRTGPWVRVSMPRRPYSLRGFSLVVDAPGRYDLGNGVEIEARIPGQAGGDGNGFPARTPTVFRSAYPEDRLVVGGKKRRIPEVLDRAGCSGYTDSIVAEDAVGIAAVILPAIDSRVMFIATDVEGGAPDLLFSILARR